MMVSLACPEESPSAEKENEGLEGGEKQSPYGSCGSFDEEENELLLDGECSQVGNAFEDGGTILQSGLHVQDEEGLPEEDHDPGPSVSMEEGLDQDQIDIGISEENEVRSLIDGQKLDLEMKRQASPSKSWADRCFHFYCAFSILVAFVLFFVALAFLFLVSWTVFGKIKQKHCGDLEVINPVNRTTVNCKALTEEQKRREREKERLKILNERLLLTKTDYAHYHKSKLNDCHRIKSYNVSAQDGPFPINLRYGLSFVNTSAFCDMTTFGGGWTIIQRRGQYENPVSFFDRKWPEYHWGFGDKEGEYWLGLNFIQMMTSVEEQQLLVELAHQNGKTYYAMYDKFYLSDDGKYSLFISGYRGNASDALGYSLNNSFSTSDNDRDKNVNRNCARDYTGGWWYGDCASANLNGLNLGHKKPTLGESKRELFWGRREEKDGDKIVHVEMKIRPRNDFIPVLPRYGLTYETESRVFVDNP